MPPCNAMGCSSRNSFRSGPNDCLKFAVWLFMGRSKSEETSHGFTKSATVAGETTSTEQQRGNREEQMEESDTTDTDH